MDGILTLLQSVKETAKGVDVNAVPSTTARISDLDGHQNSAVQSIVDRSSIANDRDNIPTFLDSTPSFTASSPSVMGIAGTNGGRPAPSGSPFNAGEISGSSYYSAYEPSPEEAEKYLANFRTQMLVNFTFIYIPPNSTAQILRQERPFLFLVIIAVSSESKPQRLVLGRDIKQMLARELLVENEGNFDMLLGLLVFLNWYIATSRHIR